MREELSEFIEGDFLRCDVAARQEPEDERGGGVWVALRALMVRWRAGVAVDDLMWWVLVMLELLEVDCCDVKGEP